MNNAALLWTTAACSALVLVWSPPGLAAAQAGTDDRTPCACDAHASQATSGKHAIFTKGTGNNRVAGPVTGPVTAPVQQVAPAASSTGQPTKNPGHVTINR